MLSSSNNLLVKRNLADNEMQLDLHLLQIKNAYATNNTNTTNFNFVAVGDWDCIDETEDTVDNIIDSIFCLRITIPIANSYKIKIICITDYSISIVHLENM